MIINKLKEIIASHGLERKKLIQEFQESIWSGEIHKDDPIYEILSELAYDLDFYEPNERLRLEDSSFYGDKRLSSEILAVLKKIEGI